MDKRAIIYIARLVAQRVIGFFLFLLGASWMLGVREIVYFGLYILIAIISGIIMYKANSETIRERGKINTNSPFWDKVLLTIYWMLAYFVIYFIAGIGYKSGVSVDYLFCVGIFLLIFSTTITLKAMIVNTYLESTARIQTDRKQKVCRDGPYSIIRHPTYSAVLIWCVAISLIFPAISVTITASAVASIIIIRTYLEDTMLKRGLDGYKTYTQDVKYRLIPFIW